MNLENGASLSWLKSEHRALLYQINELRAWWQSHRGSSTPNFGEMSRRVMDLHDRLASHFDLEEKGHFLEHAARVRPDLGSKIGPLLAEHRQFRASLAELAGRLARGGCYSSWTALDRIGNDSHRSRSARECGKRCSLSRFQRRLSRHR